MSLRRLLLPVVLTSLFGACGAPSPTVNKAAAPAPAATQILAAASSPHAGADGNQRLNHNVVPLGYELWFNLDPALDHFTGRAQISVRVASATTRIDLHASKLHISKLELQHKSGQRAAARLLQGPNGGLTILTEQAVQGEWQLRFEYEAPLDEVPESLYRVQEGDQWYAFSQFEALYARQTFPCFDEPGFKTPFRVKIRVPNGLIALSNAPVARIHTDGATHQVFDFAPTAPIPTYLVAFAAGAFSKHPADIAAADAGFEAGRILTHNVYTVAGKEHLAGYAARQTAPILRELTDYFGSPYPFAKLDQIGVPTFMFGAMENVGLVTYRENLLLLDDGRASHRDRANARSVMAHELAHMWFGNLVTPAWWDDIWLNEAFATWMANKVMGRIAPELEAPLTAVVSMLRVMQEDALSSATPIRKVIANSGDVNNAFSGITYEKGFAVLRMLETWVGPETFQRGLRSYLQRHAWKNATMVDFMTSIGEQTSLPVEQVARTFIEQPGTPLITVQSSCASTPTGVELEIQLEQERYVPLGISSERSRGKTNIWALPVCLRLINAKGAAPLPVCTVLESAKQRFSLAQAQCPVAVYPNANEAGYYHYKLNDPQLLSLSTKHLSKLSLSERVALPQHALALLQSGEIELRTFVKVLEAVAADPHRLVVEGVIAGLDQLNTFVEAPDLAQFTKRVLSPHAQRIGLYSRPGEPTNSALLRSAVFSTLGRFTRDVQLQRAATQTLEQFRTTPDQVPLERLQTLLPIAARHGDATTHATLSARLQDAAPGVREVLIESLSSFVQPELLQKTYALLLNGAIRPTERWAVLGPATVNPSLYEVYFDWYVAHEADLLELLGDQGRSDVPWDASYHCTKEGRATVVAHFQDIERFGSGADANLAQALETIDRCIALRDRFGTQVQAALK